MQKKLTMVEKNVLGLTILKLDDEEVRSE